VSEHFECWHSDTFGRVKNFAEAPFVFCGLEYRFDDFHISLHGGRCIPATNQRIAEVSNVHSFNFFQLAIDQDGVIPNDQVNPVAFTGMAFLVGVTTSL